MSWTTPWRSYAGSDGLTSAANLRGHAEGHFIIEDGVRLRVRSVFNAPSEMIGVSFYGDERRYYSWWQRVRVVRNVESE
jgi:hypothetical protein